MAWTLDETAEYSAAFIAGLGAILGIKEPGPTAEMLLVRLRESAKLERCVKSVQAKGHGEPWAICKASLGECKTEECECAGCRKLREVKDESGHEHDKGGLFTGTGGGGAAKSKDKPKQTKDDKLRQKWQDEADLTRQSMGLPADMSLPGHGSEQPAPAPAGPAPSKIVAKMQSSPKLALAALNSNGVHWGDLPPEEATARVDALAKLSAKTLEKHVNIYAELEQREGEILKNAEQAHEASPNKGHYLLQQHLDAHREKVADLSGRWKAANAALAAQALDALPSPGADEGGGKGQMIATPLPSVKAFPFETDKVEAALKTGSHKTETVPVADLITDQPKVYRGGVKQYLADPTMPSPKTQPGDASKDRMVVVKHQGKHYVYDGNHRAVAANLLGMQTIRANVVTLESIEECDHGENEGKPGPCPSGQGGAATSAEQRYVDPKVLAQEQQGARRAEQLLLSYGVARNAVNRMGRGAGHLGNAPGKIISEMSDDAKQRIIDMLGSQPAEGEEHPHFELVRLAGKAKRLQDELFRAGAITLDVSKSGTVITRPTQHARQMFRRASHESLECDQGVNKGKPGPCPEPGHDAPAAAHQSAPTTTAQHVRSMVADAVRSDIDDVKAAKLAIAKVGRGAWERLPKPVQKKLAQAYAVGKWIEHKAMIGFSKTNELAMNVAKARGMSADKAKRVARVLAVADLATAWTVNMPATFAATGSLTAAKVSSWVPVASLAYVGYSLARNPVKTMNAARAMVKGKATKHESLESVKDDAGHCHDDKGQWADCGEPGAIGPGASSVANSDRQVMPERPHIGYYELEDRMRSLAKKYNDDFLSTTLAFKRSRMSHEDIDAAQALLSQRDQWDQYQESLGNVLKNSSPGELSLEDWQSVVSGLQGVSAPSVYKKGDTGVFYRSGKPPPGGRSMNYQTGQLEDGVSTYYLPVVASMAGFADRQWFSVKGEVVGFGSDDEPLIRSLSEWKKIPKRTGDLVTDVWKAHHKK